MINGSITGKGDLAHLSALYCGGAIPKKIDTNTAPAKGDAITKKDMAMAKAPAPMLNPLAQRGRLIFFYVLSCP